MKYFVSIENIPYFHWQIELLIESFKYHNLQDQLIIGIANNDSGSLPEFVGNLLEHKNKFFHFNYGQEYKKFNKIYSLILAIKHNLIEQPFAIIHPDMLLFKPLSNFDENVVFNVDYEYSTNKIESFISSILSEKHISEETMKTLPLGDILVFNNVPLTFFNRVIDRIHQVWDKLADPRSEKYGWMLAMYDYLGLIQYKGERLEAHLVEDKNFDFNFIHYKHGLPPHFSKHLFNYDSNIALLESMNPYETLLKHNPNLVTDYVQKRIKKELAN